MAWKRPRIAILFAGGTALNGSPTLSRGIHRAADVQPWLREMGELGMIADLEPYFISAGTLTGPALWSALGKQIAAVLPSASGVVVMHEPSTAPLTAIALDAMIERANRPIVVTPGCDHGESGGRSNLINALQTATADLGGVVYVTGSHIFDARTVSRESPSGPVAGKLIGKIDFGIRLFKSASNKISGPLKMRQTFETRILTVAISQAVTAKSIGLGTKDKGVILSVDPLSAISATTWRDIAGRLPAGIPVVVAGLPDGHELPAGWQRSRGAPSVVLVRFMLALGTKPSGWKTWLKRFDEAGL